MKIPIKITKIPTKSGNFGENFGYSSYHWDMNTLKFIESPYIDAQALILMLSEKYARPREAINRMVKSGQLIRLKNGFYLIEEKLWLGKNKIIPFEQIANILYGPSYISMESALSFYGAIPERVYLMTSMVLGRTKDYSTPIGDFVYKPLSENRYAIGITLKPSPNFMGNFLIATPEKALADWVHQSSNVSAKDALKEDLIEAKRIDPQFLQGLNKSLLAEIADAYRSKKVALLSDLIGNV